MSATWLGWLAAEAVAGCLAVFGAVLLGLALLTSDWWRVVLFAFGTYGWWRTWVICHRYRRRLEVVAP